MVEAPKARLSIVVHSAGTFAVGVEHPADMPDDVRRHAFNALEQAVGALRQREVLTDADRAQQAVWDAWVAV